MKSLSKLTAALTCAGVLAAAATLRFSRDILAGMLERSGVDGLVLSNLTVFALRISGPVFLGVLAVACLVGVAVSEATQKKERPRLLLQIVILLVILCLLSVGLSGFLLPFHIPDVSID